MSIRYHLVGLGTAVLSEKLRRHRVHCNAQEEQKEQEKQQRAHPQQKKLEQQQLEQQEHTRKPTSRQHEVGSLLRYQVHDGSSIFFSNVQYLLKTIHTRPAVLQYRQYLTSRLFALIAVA